MKEILENLKAMHEGVREEHEKSKKLQLGFNEHKALQAGWILLDETLSAAEKALEKQIPKGKWKLIGHSKFGCPHCERAVYVETVMGKPVYEYCPYCGQAIDWESE